MTTLRHAGWGLALAVVLAGCGPSNTQFPVAGSTAKQTGSPYKDIKDARGSVFSRDGILADFSLGSLFGDDDDDGNATAAAAAATTGIKVNGHLWSAALDAVSFMPLASADPQGGIIQTSWYTPPDNPDERYRVNVFILSGELRADGVRVGVFRQLRDAAGNWIDMEPRRGMARDLEGIIVERARELQVASAE